MGRHRLIWPATAACVALCCVDFAIADPSSTPIEFEKFKADRARIAFDLSQPIAVCVARRDTSHAAFHGCIDWHSAVHGTWALTAYSWAFNDDRYHPIINTILTPELMRATQKELVENPHFEMPYGRAWFLRLAIDYRRLYPEADLLNELASHVAQSLIDHYTKTPPNPLSIAYDNASWALINLYDYGLSRGDKRILDFVASKVKAHYLTRTPCPLQSVEVDNGEFMAVCTNWAWLVQRVLPPDEFLRWLHHFLPTTLALDPIENPSGAHQAGLNFSRGWGLWGLYRATNDNRFLSLYLRHFHQAYANKALWQGNYRTVAHWVAQFGMLDLILTYYEGP